MTEVRDDTMLEMRFQRAEELMAPEQHTDAVPETGIYAPGGVRADMQALFRRMYESAPAAIIVLDSRGQVRAWNPAAERLFGWSEPEVLGKYSPDMPDDKWDEFRHLKTRARRGEALVAVETERQIRTGERIPVSLCAIPLFNGVRSFDGMITWVTDISPRRQAEQELTARHKRALQERKNQAVARFAGGVAHDFNHLLQPIITLAEQELGRVAKKERLHDSLSQILAAGRSARDIADQLLCFSRQQPLAMDVLNLNTLIASLEIMLRRILPDNVRLACYYEPHLDVIKADALQIQQTLMNLATNAVNAMPDGGELTLRTENVNLDLSYASEHPEVRPGPFVMLALTDSGCGMARETVETLLSNTGSDPAPAEHTGHGLHQVITMVKHHGGSICVASRPGVGTSFKIYFPRADAAPVHGK